MTIQACIIAAVLGLLLGAVAVLLFTAAVLVIIDIAEKLINKKKENMR